LTISILEIVRPRADLNNSGGAIASPFILTGSISTPLERTDIMAEYANPAIVNVTPGQNVPLLDVIGGNCGIVHRGGSGLITLRGNTNQCKARYRVAFGANIAIPEGGTIEAITAALAINGEALTTATATVTPAAAENFFNVYVSASVEVPRGCCVTVAARNTSTQAVDFANSNMEVVRTA
jgi:hypothetical protein